MSTRAFAILGLLLWVPSATYAQDDDKEKEKAAKEKVREFKKEMRKARKADDAISAIRNLAQVRHEVILDELTRLLRAYKKQEKVAEAVIDEIGRYEDSEEAAEALIGNLSYFANKVKRNSQGDETGYELAVAVLNALGRIGHKPIATDLRSYFKSASLEVAVASISAAGDIGSVFVVDDLILILQENEQLQAQGQNPGGMGQPPQGGTPPPGGMPGAPPGAPPGGQQVPPGSADQMRQEQYRRAGRINSAVQSALQNITGHSEKDASSWSTWWSKNKRELQKKEREELRKKKRRRR